MFKNFCSVLLSAFIAVFSLSAQSLPIPGFPAASEPVPNFSPPAKSGVDLYDQSKEAAPLSSQREKGNSVFGQQLFQGDFRDESFTGFNPNYQMAVGDQIQLLMWGAVQLDLVLPVDARGNIFIPEVGPVNVLGVRNDELTEIIRSSIKRVYLNNVEVYANLKSAQPVKVFVSGFVMNPGLYGGFSSDSILYYLDRAGGIDPKRGSFLDISIIRDGKVRKKVNLYKFLTEGKLELIQFTDGDLIFVNPINYTVTFSGKVNNPYQFEFLKPEFFLAEALDLTQPQPNATHVSIYRETGGEINSAYYSLEEIEGVKLESGDRVTVTSDLIPNTILVIIEGEIIGPKHLVLPYGARLNDAISNLIPSPRSDLKSIQLFREMIARRQKEMLNQSLDNLEKNILGARSSSREEAQLRIAEAELLLRFIERAKLVEPKGQVILGKSVEEKNVFLENGDVLFVPPHSSLVMVHGEVLFPNTQVYSKGDTIKDYIERAGGFSNNANRANILILRRNGAIENVKSTQGSYRYAGLNPGEELIVMPKVNVKSIQLAKDITSILFQLAIATRTIVDL